MADSHRRSRGDFDSSRRVARSDIRAVRLLDAPSCSCDPMLPVLNEGGFGRCVE